MQACLVENFTTKRQATTNNKQQQRTRLRGAYPAYPALQISISVIVKLNRRRRCRRRPRRTRERALRDSLRFYIHSAIRIITPPEEHSALLFPPHPPPLPSGVINPWFSAGAEFR